MDSLPEFILRQSATSATPLLLAGFGELLAQRAGVINVGIEGTMLMGTIAAYGAAVYTGTATAAIPAAILTGIAMSAIFALVTIWLRADQIVAGTAINLLAAGGSTTLWHYVQAYGSSHPAPALFERLTIPGLGNIPLLGPALFSQYGLFYIVLLLGGILYLLMARTRMGLVVQALGDAPEACDAAGIRVRWWRTALVLFAGATAGLAGAYLSTMRGHSFQINMTDGRGFLVLALVIFGRWKLLWFILGTFAFGAVDSLGTYLADAKAAPHQVFDMLPYAATLIALAVLTRSRSGPIYLGRPWPE